MASLSPFLAAGPVAAADKLAIVHLKRDHQVPTVLRTQDTDNEGYAEGKVVNTRFGSFPHKTMIGLPWGTQVRASKVDTGSRGRRDKKRKIEEVEDTPTEKEAVQASSGFVHLLPPTPENWTSSLPHRTQVVYTPDYSYVLHRIRARPGSNLIEAGAGSGSFTHASTRAIYNGYPEKRRKTGKVWSYEFHEQRHEKLVQELQDHGLDGLVEVTHRDVCSEGFLVNGESPQAETIFLDLPAPWLALPHLTRKTIDKDGKPIVPAISPHHPIHLCTFSPCMEQVQKTISTMRKYGWVDIDMVEVQQKRIDIRRERIGIANGNERGVQATAADVDEALSRLREVEGRFKSFHGSGDSANKRKKDKDTTNPNSRAKILEGLLERKIYKEGRLVHRAEPEVKTHTSYLVFAILPMEWTDEDEAKARETWVVKKRSIAEEAAMAEKAQSKKQQKKAAKHVNGGSKSHDKPQEAVAEPDNHVNGSI